MDRTFAEVRAAYEAWARAFGPPGRDLSQAAYDATRAAVLPMDMVDNSAGLLELASVRAGLAPARVTRTPIRPGHALTLAATLLIVD